MIQRQKDVRKEFFDRDIDIEIERIPSRVEKVRAVTAENKQKDR